MILQLFSIIDDKLNNFTFNHADQVDEFGKATGDFTIVQTDFDSRAEELRVKYNSLIDQLASLVGAENIGATKLSDGVSLSDVQTELEYLLAELQGVVLGQIPDGTVTDAKLATDNKVGSLALLLTTLKTDVVSAINEINGLVDTNTTNLDITRIAKTDTGVADAYVVDTDGTFSRIDGNTFAFIPNNNNTGASTINEDGNGVAPFQKYVDGAWVALEEGDIKKFQRVESTWNAAESAFTLAPKGKRGIQITNSSEVETALSEQTNTLKVINGEGWLTGWAFNASATILVDGVNILEAAGSAGGRKYEGYVKFTSSVVFKGSSGGTSGTISYVLADTAKPFDGKGSSKHIDTINPINEADNTSLSETILGSGYVIGYVGSESQGKMFIDGVDIRDDYRRTNGNGMQFCNFRFETSLQIHKSGSHGDNFRGWSYVLD